MLEPRSVDGVNTANRTQLRDTALLLLAASSVVGLLLCVMFQKPLNVLINSRAVMYATILQANSMRGDGGQ